VDPRIVARLALRPITTVADESEDVNVRVAAAAL
jgi:hypothetical protein